MLTMTISRPVPGGWIGRGGDVVVFQPLSEREAENRVEAMST